MVNSTDAIAKIHQVQSIFNYLSLLHLDDYKWPKSACIKEDSKPHDIVIVGAGTAGCVIANRLIERGTISVLLIEAGGDPPEQAEIPGSFLYLKRTKYDWNFTSTVDRSTMSTHRNNAVQMTQGKMLGGTSSLDYTGYGQGNKHDYDRWAKLTNDSTWSWNSVQSAFHKNEMLIDSKILNSTSKRFYGTKGKIKIMKEYFERNQEYFAAFRELNWSTPLDINPDTPVGFADVMYNIGDGERQSTARKFLSPIKRHPKLHVMKDTLATKIIFDKHKKAIGVEVLTKFKKKFIVKANIEVIVSAGVFKSPQLLILSGIGPKDHLEEKGINMIADLPVGHNLQDHANAIFVYKLTQSNKATVLKNREKFPYSTFNGYVAMNESKKYPEYQATGVSLAERLILLEFCATFFNFKLSYCNHLLKHIEDSELLFILLTNLYPKSRGLISLASTDPKDHPIIVPGYFSNYDDVINHANYCEDFNQVLKTSYFKSVEAKLILPKLKNCEEFEEGSKESWRCLTVAMSDTSYNYVGTCGMGSVLDSRLRVLGVKNLRVIDSSSFPDTIGTSTLATVIMLAQKGVDFIIDDHFTDK